MRRVVREVRVHLEEPVVAALETPAEAGDVGGAEPQLPCPMHHMDAAGLGREPVGDFAGAVRRCVVDDEHLEALILLEHERDDARQVLALVVCGNDHQPALARRLRQGVLTTSESMGRCWSPSGSSGTNASGNSSAAVNHSRDATEMSTAALAGIAGCCTSSADMVSSRTPAPAGMIITTYPAR